jgi:prolyl-tRNA synthetase
VPQRVVISDRGLKEGQVELQGRRDAQADRVSVTEVARRLNELLHERLSSAAA